jgi:hypothetical protein
MGHQRRNPPFKRWLPLVLLPPYRGTSCSGGTPRLTTGRDVVTGHLLRLVIVVDDSCSTPCGVAAWWQRKGVVCSQGQSVCSTTACSSSQSLENITLIQAQNVIVFQSIELHPLLRIGGTASQASYGAQIMPKCCLRASYQSS